MFAVASTFCQISCFFRSSYHLSSGSLKTLYESGYHGCNATQNFQNLRFPGTCNVHYFQTKLILTSLRPFLITYTTKPYVRSETYIAYKFYALYPKKGILEGNFCLCVENVMRVLDPLFLHIKSWCRKTLNILGFGGHNWKNTFCT